MGKKQKITADPAFGASAQRNYKDTVFRMLYRDKSELLELYNAVNGTNYTDPEELEAVGLENAIYMAMKKRRENPTLIKNGVAILWFYGSTCTNTNRR